jgi:hypothetical protein
MKAIEYLTRAKRLDEQINNKLHQIACLRSMAAKVDASGARAGGGQYPNPDRLQNAVLRIVEAEKALDRDIDRLMEIKMEIGETIAEVRDMNQRTVLEKRYLCFMNGREIAEEMHYTGRWIRHFLAEGIRAVQEILDRKEEGETVRKPLRASEG